MKRPTRRATPGPGLSIAGLLITVLLVMSTIPLMVGALKMIDVGEEFLRVKIEEQQIQEADLLAAELVRQHQMAQASLKELSSGLHFLMMSTLTPEERKERITAAIEDVFRRVPWQALELRTTSEEVYRVRAESIPQRGLGPAWETTFQQALLNGETVAILPAGTRSDLVALYGYRYGGGETATVVALGALDTRPFQRVILQRTSPGRYVFVLQNVPPYRVLISNDPAGIPVGQPLHQAHPLAGSTAALNRSYTVTYAGKSVRVLGAARPLPELNALLIVETDMQNALAVVRQMARTGIQWAAGVTLITVLLALIAARFLSRPIRRLAQTTHQIAETRNFHRRLRVQGLQEVRILKVAFNRLLDEIQAYVRKLEDKAEENRRLFYDSIKMLAAAIDAKDPYTRGHSERVSRYARTIAQFMDFSDEEIEKVYLAGLLHDVGKIGIQDRILQKPAALTDEEYEIMKTHPERGYKIMKEIKQLADVVPGMRYHHENWDGTGYPFGLKGEQIPLIARIIAVADTFDAMTTDRPYQRRMPAEKAVERIVMLSGRRFDPKVVQAFVQAYEQGAFQVISEVEAPEWLEAIEVPLGSTSPGGPEDPPGRRSGSAGGGL
ncbi:MAG: HD domain-containing protein [Acidobacteria bacterium]|nr:HD domain-containing protein [Acidobacteriota bacterium]MDW7983362.1 HD domain-containing protein [Acidobacteriota bacterium]